MSEQESVNACEEKKVIKGKVERKSSIFASKKMTGGKDALQERGEDVWIMEKKNQPPSKYKDSR